MRANGLEPGSWRTVYMNHRLADLVPEVHAKLHSAVREVDARHWQIIDEPNRRSLNLRVAEYHTVLPSGGLPMHKHHDRGSLVTMDLMLSSPGADFEGGIFQTLEADGNLRRILPEPPATSLNKGAPSLTADATRLAHALARSAPERLVRVLSSRAQASHTRATRPSSRGTVTAATFL